MPLIPYEDAIDISHIKEDPNLEKFADAFRAECIKDNEELNLLLAKKKKKS